MIFSKLTLTDRNAGLVDANVEFDRLKCRFGHFQKGDLKVDLKVDWAFMRGPKKVDLKVDLKVDWASMRGPKKVDLKVNLKVDLNSMGIS